MAHANKTLAERRVPCLVTFLHPFRIIDGPETTAWEVSIEQINSGSWDYASLHEVVGGIDVGLEAPYHLVVCRDGGLALPPIPELRDELKAVEFFNQCLGAFLLGGVYCEAIALDGLDFGSVLDWKYVRTNGISQAMPNRFHHLIRLQAASPYEAIQLQEPNKLELNELIDAASTGRDILKKIPEMGADFLLRGATGFARRDWGVSLTNFWIVIEQITSHLWKAEILEGAKADKKAKGRLDSLKDNRTWTVGVRQEVLYQRGFITGVAFTELNIARKSRNKLSHTGQIPDEISAKSALNAIRELLNTVVPNLSSSFLELDLTKKGLSDPFRPKNGGKIEPRYWMEIKKLPGEADLEKAEAFARKKAITTKSKSNDLE